MDASAETCARRIRQRGRPEELAMSDLDGYVGLLHRHYAHYHETAMQRVPLLTLDNDTDSTDPDTLVNAAWDWLTERAISK